MGVRSFQSVLVPPFHDCETDVYSVTPFGRGKSIPTSARIDLFLLSA